MPFPYSVAYHPPAFYVLQYSLWVDACSWGFASSRIPLILTPPSWVAAHWLWIFSWVGDSYRWCQLYEHFYLRWLVSPKVRPTIYLCKVGNEIPIMGRPPEANLVAQIIEFIVPPMSSYPFLCIPRGVPCLMVSSSSSVVPHNFVSCMSLALNFSNSYSHSFGLYL